MEEHLCGGELSLPIQSLVLFFSQSGSDKYLSRAASRMSYCYQRAAALASELIQICGGPPNPLRDQAFLSVVMLEGLKPSEGLHFSSS